MSEARTGRTVMVESLRMMRTGRAVAEPRPVALRAGPLSLELHGSVVRHVRRGRLEILGALLCAVRDEPWNTIPGTLLGRRIERGPDAFRVEVENDHAHGPVAFRWQGTIEGRSDGSLTYAFRGVAGSSFAYMRIGFAAEQPVAAWRARPYVVRGGAERERHGVLPDADIGEAPFRDGKDVALIAAYREMEADLDGLRVVLALEGDELELEDQRNWSDASFKAFCTPASLPAPFEARPGMVIEQRFTLRTSGRPGRRPRPAPSVRLGTVSETLPRIGLGAASHIEPMGPRSAGLLRTVGAAHLRVDLDVSRDEATERLRAAVAEARVLEVPLEVALLVDARPGAGLAPLAEAIRASGVPVARAIALPRPGGEGGPWLADPALVHGVREALRAAAIGAPVLAGTDLSFTELNRSADRPIEGDGVAYPLSPSVHSWDGGSLMENLGVQAEMVAQAGRIGGGRPVHVGPVTLATRSGPFPAGPDGIDGLPPGVDPRGRALLGAAWTVGCLTQLAAGGAASTTLFETSGMRGIVERDSGSADPRRWPSASGSPYPIFHVLADLAGLHGRPTHESEVPDVSRVAVLAVARGDGGVRMLVANLLPRSQRVALADLPGRSASLRALDERSFVTARDTPAAFRRSSDRVVVRDGGLDLQLRPFAVVTLDLADATG